MAAAPSNQYFTDSIPATNNLMAAAHVTNTLMAASPVTNALMAGAPRNHRA